jgi:ribosomal protein S18 acetylase RimI-like enzyme
VGRLGMGVRSECRRQGIGRRLLDACLSLARNTAIEKVELEVFSDNIVAVRLYGTARLSACAGRRESAHLTAVLLGSSAGFT